MKKIGNYDKKQTNLIEINLGTESPSSHTASDGIREAENVNKI
jgi:hypothetical protein